MIKIFKPFLQKITDEMDERFTAQFKDMSYDVAKESYSKLAVKSVKEFIQLIMVQGMNNVTEVHHN
jgi:hypothetical protein